MVVTFKIVLVAEIHNNASRTNIDIDPEIGPTDANIANRSSKPHTFTMHRGGAKMQRFKVIIPKTQFSLRFAKIGVVFREPKKISIPGLNL